MITTTDNRKAALLSTDSEVEENRDNASGTIKASTLVKYLFAGIYLGVLFIKSEILSWFRIQEMFRLQSFHMYGIIGSAIITGALSVWIIKRTRAKAMDGSAITFTPKKFHKGQVFGGLLFGLGWALTGACPGPLFAQVGAGYTVVLVIIASAVAGTWVYGYLRDRLPH